MTGTSSASQMASMGGKMHTTTTVKHAHAPEAFISIQLEKVHCNTRTISVVSVSSHSPQVNSKFEISASKFALDSHFLPVSLG